MAIAICAATLDRLINVEVCPHYDTTANACGCPAAGADPAQSHRHFSFPASSGDPHDARTPGQWAAACALEARRLVAHELVGPQASAISALIGTTGT